MLARFAGWCHGWPGWAGDCGLGLLGGFWDNEYGAVVSPESIYALRSLHSAASQAEQR